MIFRFLQKITIYLKLTYFLLKIKYKNKLLKFLVILFLPKKLAFGGNLTNGIMVIYLVK